MAGIASHGSLAGNEFQQRVHCPAIPWFEYLIIAPNQTRRFGRVLMICSPSLRGRPREHGRHFAGRRHCRRHATTRRRGITASARFASWDAGSAGGALAAYDSPNSPKITVTKQYIPR